VPARAAQVLRHTKTKKSTFTNFEVFRVRDAGMPNETLTVQPVVEYVAFEPSPGCRFGVVTSNEGRFDVSFYTLGATRNGVKLEPWVVLENKQANQLHWAPVGGVCILAGLDALNGQLEFYDVDAKLSMNQAEHYMCNEIHWDPSGRMVATVVSQPMFGAVSVRFTLENGFKLWSFQGQKLQEKPQADFYQFLWRPRPKSLLSEDDFEELKKKLPSYSKTYEREDALIRKRRQASENAERLKQLVQFRDMMEERRIVFLEQKREREARGVWRQEDDELLEISEVVEELVSEKTEVV
jgi:translation initiation factor 3 subunit B